MQLWDAEDLAARWKVSTDHVYRLARENKIPHVKLGRYTRFHPKVVEEWELGTDNRGA